MKKVSVVVPVYNAQKYVSTCMDSLLNQTLEEIEIIAVDDGSKDESLRILEEYEKKYSEKVKVFHKENGGLSDTRNFGLQKITGEYVAFVDSDDYVEKTMLEEMYQKAKEKDYEIVCCQVNAIYPDHSFVIDCGISQSDTNLMLEEKKQILFSLYPIVCNKIYKSSLLQGKECFKKGVWFEDVLFLYKLLPFIQSIGVVPKPFYQYLQNPNSITYSYNEKLYDMITNFDEIIQFYKEKELYEEYQDILEYSYVRYVYATFVKRLAKAKDKKIFRQGVKDAKAKVKEHFPNYRKNKFLKKKTGKNIYLTYFNNFFAMLVYYMEKDRMN